MPCCAFHLANHHMAQIHYFQRYHNREDVVTNNTLLLFGRLYQHSPVLFEQFLNVLLPEANIAVGISMLQQISSGTGSRPDGQLVQSGFRLVIETKLGRHFSHAQLKKHLGAFEQQQYAFLFRCVGCGR